jgi:hypothetical protein
MMRFSTHEESADDLRVQADSCRRLALHARTMNGSEALQTVAHQFDADAARIDRAGLDETRNGDAAALVRVRLALEHQSIRWLGPHRAGNDGGAPDSWKT